MGLFRKKQEFCAICNIKLKFRYKPNKLWQINGYLCNNCHIDKTREFMLKKQQEDKLAEKKEEYCFVCNKKLDDERKKPPWKWNMESGIFLCPVCFSQKESEYEKRLNYCVRCDAKIGFIRYNPKPKWNIQGQLCRPCWDILNKI
jgi:hypothetical protein